MARVLIVDDERSIRLDLAEFLRAEGNDVVEAEDAESVQQHLKEGRFDLVVSDIVMPRLTGLALLRTVRDLAPETPVVILTGEPTMESAREAVRQGALDYLTKPVTKEAILRVVAHALRLKALVEEKLRLEVQNRDCQESLERLVEERTRALAQELAERKRAEQALRESEARLETLFEHSPVAIWEEDFSSLRVRLEAIKASGVTDLEGYLTEHPDELAACVGSVKVLRVNETSARLFGCAKEDVPRELAAYFTWESMRVFANECACFAAGHSRWQGEVPVRSPRNEDLLFQVLAAMVPGHEEKWDRVVISFLNITARKQAEQDLQSTVAKYRALFSAIPVGVTVTDSKGEIAEVNREAERLLGVSLDEHKRRGIGGEEWRIVRPDGSPMPAGEYASVRALCEQRLVEGVEMGINKPGGETTWISVTAAPILWQNLGVVITYHDITDRRRAEQRARRDARRTELLLELHQRAPQMEDRGLFDYVLEQAVELTDSVIGFFHQVSDDQQTILMTTWNHAALQSCTASFATHYPLKEAGNWVDCVRERRPIVYNDYAQSPHRQGLPPGHTTLERFMSIPVIQDGLVRIIFGVGNKPEDYDETDVAQLQLVANELYKVMTHRAAERRLRQLSRAVEQSAAMTVITDSQGAIDYVNPKFTQVTGYTLAEVRGRNPRLLRSGRTPPETYVQLWKTILSGHEWRGEFCNRKKNQELYWVSASVSPITDASGKLAYFVAVTEDITERKRTEALRQALLSLGERLNRTADPADAGRALLATADQLWQWDAAAVDVQAPNGTQFQSLLRVDVLEGVRQEIANDASYFDPTPRMRRVSVSGGELILNRGAAGEEIGPLAFGDRLRQSASIMVVPIRCENDLMGMLSLHSYQPNAYTPADLPVLQALADHCGGALNRIRSGAARRRSEERYRALVETTCDWIWEVDAQARYTYASPRVQDILGYSPAEMLGKTPFDFMAPEDARRIGAVFGEFVAARRGFAALENACRHKDGRSVILETSAVPIFNAAGEFSGYRGMDRDISERKRLESAFRQAQKLDAVGQLAGGVAHDFNNILAAILLQLGMLSMRTDLDPSTKQALQELDEEARRAASLTRQLLMFSRRSVLQVKALDLNEVVRNLLKMLNRLIGEHNKLEAELQSPLLQVEADAGMLEQVVMNLVVNARDAMPRGGRILIATSMASLTEVEAAWHPDRRPGDFVCLSVADNGCGMDEKTLKRIFEPFFTTKEAGKGTGLGLATVHGIVAQHRGWVEVESVLA
jgi:PAS domain S-box-containing protein